MWCPALAAVLTCRIARRDLSTLGWRWPRNNYMLASYLIPLAYAAVAYGAAWALHLGGFNREFVQQVAQGFGLKGLPSWAALGLYLILGSTVGLVRSCATALREEIGWRGFLVPELARMTSFTKTALISRSGHSGTGPSCCSPTTTPARPPGTGLPASASWCWP
jgi:hypothetical protein